MAKIMALSTFTIFTGKEMVVFNKGETDPITGKPIYRPIPDNLAQTYIDAGLAQEEQAEDAGKTDTVALASLNKAQLIAFAGEQNIAIEPAKTKAEIIAAIEAELAARAEAEQANGAGGSTGEGGADGEGAPPA